MPAQANMNRMSHRLLTGAALLALCACAVGPLQPDPAARAPALTGFGELQVPVTTNSPAAQHWYTQGVLQAYAFNEAEAIRMFKAALAQDPDCAMCAWGVAWQLGPNINDTDRARVPEALGYVDLALRHVAGATPRERALIDALALRYGHASKARETAPLLAERCGAGGDDEPADPLDLAYAERMRALALASADDPEILALWAEAEMVATRDDWWSKGGTPAGHIGELTAALESALRKHPQHIGLNHYLIHATDSGADGVARRALAAADRLGTLAPGSPHLVHMPAHTYVHVGRYDDAARVNESALAVEVVLREAQRTQGFEISKDWRNHDQHFLWFAALMQGRGDAALAAARGVAERAAASQSIYGEYRRSLPVLALLRLQRWEALLAEPPPTGTQGLAQVLDGHARGVALARTGHLREARAALAQVDAGAAIVNRTHPSNKSFDRTLRDTVAASGDRLRAEIAFAEGRHDAAFALQAQAVLESQRPDESEPPMLGAGARLVLGEMQLRAGRNREAEQTYREDLVAQSGSGWALHGLARALQAQGKAADAQELQAPLASAWASADAALRAAP
ncbi:MAG: tetratricopeptide repeat protein [Croceibacterium sp.]